MVSLCWSCKCNSQRLHRHTRRTFWAREHEAGILLKQLDSFQTAILIAGFDNVLDRLDATSECLQNVAMFLDNPVNLYKSVVEYNFKTRSSFDTYESEAKAVPAHHKYADEAKGARKWKKVFDEDDGEQKDEHLYAKTEVCCWNLQRYMWLSSCWTYKMNVVIWNSQQQVWVSDMHSRRINHQWHWRRYVALQPNFGRSIQMTLMRALSKNLSSITSPIPPEWEGNLIELRKESRPRKFAGYIPKCKNRITNVFVSTSSQFQWRKIVLISETYKERTENNYETCTPFIFGNFSCKRK